MKRVLVCLLLCATAYAADLQKQLDALAAAHHGKVAFFAKNLDTGQTVAVDPDHVVKTASVIKLPLLVEAFRQVKAGQTKLDDPITLNKENVSSGSGVLFLMHPGLQLTVSDTLSLMVVLSDNTATNLLVDKIGLKPTNEWLASKGLKNTHFYKKIGVKATEPMPADQKQFGLGKTTPREMATVMESIYRCEIGDKELCGKMLYILRNQQYRAMVPRYIELPDASEDLSGIADKVGALDAVRNDVALIHTKRGHLIISAFTYDNKDQSWTPENEAEMLIGKMAKAIVDEWGGEVVTGGDFMAK